ncbi:DUF192 domain-containing protein [Candidatus Poriferisodalis sp.]|uniref:DUF192 domain-containing protein n=1 Tax=Candidatus Poriferisodalis sp. TaxID=3101277 RepID=UPI003B023206
MQQSRRLAAAVIVAVALGGCSVQESTRSGGLVAPTGPAVTASVPVPTVVTVAAGKPIAATLSGTFPPPETTSDDVLGALEPPAETSRAAGSPQTAASDTKATADDNESPPQTVAPTALQPATTDVDSLAHVRDVLATATPPVGFGEGVLGVTGSAGTRLWPVVIADTPQARQRGLMGVDDFSALGGYAAMVFVFETDISGAFWMRDTPLPLRITFVTASGSVVSAIDMVPCLAPTPSEECERYHAGGPYRMAIEHPVGPAFDIGLDGATFVEVTIE